MHGERSFGAVCWCAGEWGDRGAARKSWGRQGKGHLGDAGGVSPPCGVAVRGREAVGLLGEGALRPGDAGVAARWPSQNGQIQPQISALALGMGESWHCWALAARLWASPFDLLALHPSANSHSPSTCLAMCRIRNGGDKITESQNWPGSAQYITYQMALHDASEISVQ